MPLSPAEERLVEGIILKAVEDYRIALLRLKRYPKDIEGNKYKSDCERFFRSQWFCSLTSLDGEEIIQRIKKEVR